MLRLGQIKSIDRHSNTGVLVDQKGIEYFFDASECYGEEIPKRGTTVSFTRDEDYKRTNVALQICECEGIVQTA
jgi:hypothetical protein